MTTSSGLALAVIELDMRLPVKFLRVRNLARIISVVLLGLALQACSTIKLAYNQAPEVAWWYLTDYVEFTDTQRPVVRASLVQLHGWHRRDQLPGYAETLQKWQQPLLGDMNAEQACVVYTDVLGRLMALADLPGRLEPQALAVWTSLSPAQLAALERNFTKSNQKYRKEFLTDSPRVLGENRLKRAASRAETLYGSINERQLGVLQAALERVAFDGEEAYSRRLWRQQDWLKTLRTISSGAVTAEQARVALRGSIERSVQLGDPAQRQQEETARLRSCQVMAELHNSTTPAQRSYAAQTLGRYAADLRLLAREP